MEHSIGGSSLQKERCYRNSSDAFNTNGCCISGFMLVFEHSATTFSDRLSISQLHCSSQMACNSWRPEISSFQSYCHVEDQRPRICQAKNRDYVMNKYMSSVAPKLQKHMSQQCHLSLHALEHVCPLLIILGWLTGGRDWRE